MSNKKKGVIPIVCGIDEEYVMPLSVMLYSICSNLSKDYSIDIYVISEGVSEDKKTKVEEVVCERFRFAQLIWINPNIDSKDLPATGHISEAAYYRLLSPYVIPNSQDKVLYLDADMVVESDISQLYETKLEGNTVAAVQSFSPKTIKESPIRGGRNCVNEEGRYFNSGVMLINSTRWRERQIKRKVVRYKTNNHNDDSYHDQDGLNVHLSGDWKCIDPKWNVTIPSAPEYFGVDRDQIETLIERNEFHILHFTTRFKPWNTLGRVPGHDRFYHYLLQSGWFSTPSYLCWKIRKDVSSLVAGINRRSGRFFLHY